VKGSQLPMPWMAAAAVALALGSADLRPARAGFELINNGGFEAGFAGWNRQDFLASEGTFFLQSGVTSPVNSDPVPSPPVRPLRGDVRRPGGRAPTSSTRTSWCPRP